ncbi:MAG: hypothetical protein HWD60_03380 [Defluviicoccus sp.]|nr:MAG: hypothetical protein HWD60_03380 [Defluviicoccus sp.]
MRKHPSPRSWNSSRRDAFEAAALIETREHGCWPRRALHLAAMTYERLLRPAEAIDIWLEYDERFP